MSLSLTLASLWVLASVGVAMLPLRHQYAPGLALLLLAPGLIVYLGWEHGGIVALLGVGAFLSMFRNPLVYIYRRLSGQRPDLPK